VSQMASQTAEAGRQVGSTAKEQATEVVDRGKREARDLLGQGRSVLKDQTTQQQKQVADKVRSLADDLGSMAGQTSQGQAGDLVQELSSRTSQLADWLEREPSQLLGDVSSFARRRPGAFLAVALGAGLLVGRLGRGAKDLQSEESASGSSTGSGTGSDLGAGRHAADSGVAPSYPAAPPVVGPAGTPGTVAGAQGDPLMPETGSAGLSGPGQGPAGTTRDGLTGPYDDPLR